MSRFYTRCLKDIQQNLQDDFRTSLKMFINYMTETSGYIQYNFEPMKRISIVLSCCILYKRPEFISIVNDEIEEDFSQDLQDTIKLAESLQYHECLRELRPIVQLCSSNTSQSVPRCGDAMSTLCFLASQYPSIGADISVIKNCFMRLCENGYDFAHTADNNLPPLYHMFPLARRDGSYTLCHSTLYLLKIMFDAGVDINERHTGRSPFFTVFCRLVTGWDHTCFEVFSAAVKLCLFHNPSVEINQRVMECIVKNDIRLFDQYQGKDIQQFLEWRLVPTFYMLGYKLKPADLQKAFDTYATQKPHGLQISFNEIPAIFVDTIRDALDQPMCLKGMCRIALRQTYSGNRIHQYAETVPMPTSIKHYITLQSYGNIGTPPGP